MRSFSRKNILIKAITKQQQQQQQQKKHTANTKPDKINNQTTKQTNKQTQDKANAKKKVNQ